MSKRTLTARFCETVKPPSEGRLTFADAALPGFRFRVSATGKRSFSLVYRGADRKQRRLTWECPAHDLKRARDAARGALRAVGRGEAPATEKQVAVTRALSLPGTLGDLCDRYIDQHLKRNIRRWEQPKGEIDNHIRPRLGELSLGEVTRAHVRELVAEIEVDHPVAANRVLSRLRAVYNWASERELVDSNPTLGIKKPTREKPVSRILSDDELRAVWEATDALRYPARELFRFLVLSGQRRDDVRLMHWREIDMAGHDWTIPADRYKGGRAHLIRLTDTMIDMLEAMPFRDRGGYVFSVDGGAKPYVNVTKPKRALDRVAGVDGWTLHDLRRTLRTGLSRLGIRPEVSERVIGHSVGGRLGQTYDLHEYSAEKLTALEAWDAHVLAVVGGGNNVVAINAR